MESNKLKVNVRFNKDSIESSISTSGYTFDPVVRIMELHEEAVRAALIKLGWTPPKQ